MTPQDVLRQAADLIERTGWCQGVSAMNDSLIPVPVDDPSACRFCAIGAIRHVGATRGCYIESVDAVHALALVIDDDYIGLWNDAPARTKEEVIATLRRAAETA